MREVYTNIQLKLLLISPLGNWGITAITTASSRTRLLKIFSRAASTEGWLTDGLPTEKCFFLQQQDSLALASPYCSQDLTQIDCKKGTKFKMLLIILNISHLNDIGDADSRAGCSLTDSWGCNSFCTKPALTCIFHCLPSWHNFLPTRLKIGNYGANLYTNCSPRIKLRTLSNSNCGSNGSV